ncbi:MAG: hypothetical protein AAGG09_05580, partial [Pseudomonadota bacterium]
GVGILGAVLMILGSVPRYTAVETVLLDEERADLLNAISPLPNAVRSDTAVRSEIEIIHSRALAYRVVDMLELDQDADFLSPPVGATQRVTGAIGALTDPLARLLTPGPRAPSPSPGTGGPAAAAPAPLFDLSTTDRDRAAGLLRDRVSASRAGRSLVIRIGYTGFDPTRAAMIARGYGTAYESFQLQTSTEVAGTAEAWLRARIGVMEERSIAAAAAVQEFRAANGLVEARGSLLTEQQQSELASALVAAAANAAEAEAQLESMEALLARARGGEEVIGVPLADGPVRGTIEEFRRTYLDARLRYGRLVDRFGADHPQALELADTIEDVRGAIQVELEQATEAARVAYAVARSREDSLQSDLAATTGPSADGVTLRGRLLQLEAISETYAQLYRDYLARLEVTMQQQGFPIAAVKILSPAEVPKGASSPRKKAMLLAGMLLGGFVGVMIGAGRELLPKPVRTASALRDEVGVRCAGLLPGSGQDAARARTLDRLVQACEGEEEEGGRIVALAPLTAPLPEEETLPMELGERLSDGGARRVLVLYDDTPDRVPADPPVEALSLQTLLGSIVPQRPSGAPDFEALGEELRARYAFVVLAMQPIAGARRADAHSWAYDATVLRVPWGRVLPGFVSDALRDHPAFRARLVTTVLEGAHLPTARKYMSPGSYEERQTYA